MDHPVAAEGYDPAIRVAAATAIAPPRPANINTGSDDVKRLLAPAGIRGLPTVRPVLVAVSLVWLATALAASTFIMPTDEELLRKSELVVVATVHFADAAPVERPATDYTIEVTRLVKGYVPANTLIVRELGGLAADRSSALTVHGAARLAVGEEYLLFLEPSEEARFRVMDLGLGAFRRNRATGFAERSLGAGRLLERPGDPKAAERRRSTGLRHFDAFVDALATHAQGEQLRNDYFVGGPDTNSEGLVADQNDFNLTRSPEGVPPNACPANAGSPVRWQQFDTGDQVLVFANQGGQIGVPGGGFSQIQQAVTAWNAVAGAQTNLVYGGTTPVDTAIAGQDLLNTISFEDPNDQVAGSYPSAQSGAVSVTLVWFQCNVHPFLGGVAHKLLEAGIVTQDGTGSFFFDAVNFAEVMAHELGHLLGLAHSCGDPETGPCTGAADAALMRAFPHDDGRGISIRTDDRNGLLALYGAATGPGPTPPSSLTAEVTSTSTIQLNWVDNSADEDGFSVEQRLLPSTDFVFLGNVPANTTTTSFSGFAAETAVEFRVRSFNDEAFSAYSNVASATTFAQPEPCVPDGQTLCLTEGRFRVTAEWATTQGTSGQGQAEDITTDTGYFWFFDEDNVEMVVKVLDACVPALGNRFWVFAGGLTNVEVVLRVVDSETGFTRTYTNPQSTPFQPIQDTQAFETCP